MEENKDLTEIELLEMGRYMDMQALSDYYHKLEADKKYFLATYGSHFTFSKRALKELLEEEESYEPIGIVEVIEDTKYSNSIHKYFREKEVNNDKLSTKRLYEYVSTTTDSYLKVEYLCYQTCGICGDDYSGFLLLPMKDGKYYKVYFTC